MIACDSFLQAVLLFTNHDISSCHRILVPLFDRSENLPEYVPSASATAILVQALCRCPPLSRLLPGFTCAFHTLCLRWWCQGRCNRSALRFSVGLLLLEVYFEWQLPGMTLIGLLLINPRRHVSCSLSLYLFSLSLSVHPFVLIIIRKCLFEFAAQFI